MTDISKLTFAGHLKATLVLGAPLVAAQLSQMLIGVVDTIMLGWLGTEELAAGTLAFQAFFICLIFGIGFGAGMMPLIAGALGADNPQEVRRATRMGLWALLGLGLVLQLPLWFTGELLLLLGQDPLLAQLAEGYMRIAQWSLIPALMIIGLRAFLTSIERPNAVLGITIFTAILNGVFNYAFIFGNFGAPRLEMQGAAVATLLANVLAFLAAFAYVAWLKEAKPYALFTRFWRPDWPALSETFRIGVPVSLTIFAEAGLFSAASLMIGWLGTVPLAAHGIALQIASIAFMIPMGLSQAGSVRVGRAAGAGDRRAIGRAGHATLLLALIFAVASALVMLVYPDALVMLFLDADDASLPAVVAYAVPLLWTAAAFQLVDSAQAVGAGNLRGLKDTKIPLVIAVISYWGVGLSVAYIFAFPAGLGGVGVWSGLAAGLGVAAILLNSRFERRDRLNLTPEGQLAH
ncbi:MAG: MATE family efflux transporter [Ahrensia sp.]|nr:MATE family efflux transporter [Ahrensia sp.]